MKRITLLLLLAGCQSNETNWLALAELCKIMDEDTPVMECVKTIHNEDRKDRMICSFTNDC